jgi:RNA polymerase subunit RPABC4/transcription elongation factor Spt4
MATRVGGYLRSCGRCGHMAPSRQEYCGVCGSRMGGPPGKVAAPTAALPRSAPAAASEPARLVACEKCLQFNPGRYTFCSACGAKLPVLPQGLLGTDTTGGDTAGAAQGAALPRPAYYPRRKRVNVVILPMAVLAVLAGVLLVVRSPDTRSQVASVLSRHTPTPAVPEVVKAQAREQMTAGLVQRDAGNLGAALDSLSQAFATWPGLTEVPALIEQLVPQATATAVAVATEQARISGEATATARAVMVEATQAAATAQAEVARVAATAQAQEAAAAAQATQSARNPPVTVLSQNVRQVDSRVHILGEVRNDSSQIVFWQIQASLHDAAGASVATWTVEANRVHASTNVWRWPAPPMRPGEVHPYWLAISNAPAFAEARLTARAVPYTVQYPRLLALPPQLAPNLSPVRSGQGSGLAVRGTVTNNTGEPVEAHVLVWYVDGAGKVLEARDQRLLQPAPLHPGASGQVDEQAGPPGAALAKWVVWGTAPPNP